ncbi:MAG: nitroreductase [Desulforhopalus sp.]|jgi:nitroreductase
MQSMIKDIVTKSRSYRRFDEDFQVKEQTLVELVELARLTPSGGNLQPLKYLLSATAEKNDRIFPALKWAGYLKDWSGPDKGERPSAYIVILGDKEITTNFGCDHGIVAQTMLLGAVEQGLGGCMIGAFNLEKLRTALGLPEQLEVLLVIALGKPVEKVLIDPIDADGNIKYWRDENLVHHVPKRDLKDMIFPH